MRSLHLVRILSRGRKDLGLPCRWDILSGNRARRESFHGDTFGSRKDQFCLEMVRMCSDVDRDLGYRRISNKSYRHESMCGYDYSLSRMRELYFVCGRLSASIWTVVMHLRQWKVWQLLCWSFEEGERGGKVCAS
jgi:hypothetical protein